MSEQPPPAGGGFKAEAAGFTTGSVVAGYRLGERIGQGGMAVVYLAHDDRLRRRVALKILAPGLAADEAFRRRFMSESRAAAAVDDPHIIPVYEAGEAGDVLFIAMRYVRGGDVRTLLRRAGPLSGERAADIVSPVASALDAAHESGLVHRDVKPANMLIDVRPGRPDHVYLSDFGISKGALSSVELTGTGQLLGTPDYCAPEQLRGGAVNGRTDQYALACAAFEMLTGAPPFRRDHGLAVIYAHLSEPPPLATTRRPDLPTAVDQVLARALAKVPDARYPTCREFADDLREAMDLRPYAPAPAVSRPTALQAAIADPVLVPPPGQTPAEIPAAEEATITGHRIPVPDDADTVPPQPAPEPAGETGHPAAPPPDRGQPPTAESGFTEPGGAVSPASAATEPGARLGTAEPDAAAGQMTQARPLRRWPVMTSVLALVVLLIAGGLFFGYQYTQSHYYIGVDHGQIAIFRGLSQPVIGISLHSVQQRTGIPLSGIPADEAQAIRAGTIPAGSLARERQAVATIRKAYQRCLAAYAAVRFWEAHKPKPFKVTVVHHGRPLTRLVTPKYRPRPPIPTGCPPMPPAT